MDPNMIEPTAFFQPIAPLAADDGISENGTTSTSALTRENSAGGDVKIPSFFKVHVYVWDDTTPREILEEVLALSAAARRVLMPPPPVVLTTETTSSGTRYYEFTPYAATQEYVMLPMSRCTSPDERVHFTTFPQIRNVMHTEFDSMGPLRTITMLTGDDLHPTAEFLQNLAFYLRHRVEEIIGGEEAFKRTAITTTIDSDSVNSPLQSGKSHSFSTETPVVCFFGNGRLAWLLNNSEFLPFPVLPVQTPEQAASRDRRQKSLLAQHGLLPDLVKDGAVANSIGTVFPCETISVADALRKYRPCIALVEPHVDRDWLCDVRGFYSMREVLALGPVDSPAMGSFTFPFLSFGVTPGPTTYWTYSDSLQRVMNASRIQMPMDPPHVAQGYARRELDAISAYMISPNDCQTFGSQHRCLSFVRTLYPVKNRQSMQSTGSASGATPT